tara:strand:- start:525 stop:935 length:411 start_codon:yes stop_codon:yes gene_type:complete
MPPSSSSPPLVPLEEMLFEMGGRTFQYDKVMVLDELTRCTDLNNRAVRICRPPMPGEGHKGRIKVQFLVGGVSTFPKPENLFELTPERREALPEADKTDVALYEHTQKSCLGVDMVTGGRVYSTRGPTTTTTNTNA